LTGYGGTGVEWWSHAFSERRRGAPCLGLGGRLQFSGDVELELDGGLAGAGDLDGGVEPLGVAGVLDVLASG